MDWVTAGQTVSEGIKGIFNSINSFLTEVDWVAIGESIKTFLQNIDWAGIWETVRQTIKNAFYGVGGLFEGLLGEDNSVSVFIKNVGDILDDLLGTIQEIASSENFQTFLDGVSTAFAGISQFIKPVLDDLTSLLVPIAEIALSTVGTVLNTIGDALNWIGSNEIAITLLEALAIAIGLVTTALTLYKVIQSGVIIQKIKETAVLIANAAAWIAANLPIILITAAIAAVIAIIILCVKHWDTIKETVENVCNAIKEKAIELKDKVVEKFTEIKDNISEKLENIKTKVQEIWENIKSTIKEKIDNVKTNISNTLNNIKNTWESIWTNLKTTVSNVWDGIWSTIKNVINNILGGIEGFANGIVRGINKVLSGLDGIVNAVGQVIGLDIHVSPLSEISLPRLANGNVAYEETLAIFGEYSGASYDPEITAPQSTIADTFRNVLSEFNGNNSNGGLEKIEFRFGSIKVAYEIADLLNQAKRNNGKAIIEI